MIKMQSLSLLLMLLISYSSKSSVVTGTVLSRQFCNKISYISELKIDNQIILKNYKTNNGQFILKDIKQGKYDFEITSFGHYKTLILEVIIDKDSVDLPTFKLHPIINDGYTDLMGNLKGSRPERNYYENGNLRSEGKYKFKVHIKYVAGYFLNVKNGLWKYYYENGNRQREIYYKNGTPNGQITEYDINGKILLDGYICDGINCKQYIYYNKDGEIDSIAEFKNNNSQVLKFSEIYILDSTCEGWVNY